MPLFLLTVLACGTLTVDDSLLATVDDLMTRLPPDARVPMLIQGATEAGVVGSGCASLIAKAKVASASPANRQGYVRNVVLGASSCPAPCASLDSVSEVPPGRQTAALAEACGGVDPFGGSLAPLRDKADPADYLLTRMLFERATKHRPRLWDHAQGLAIGLALAGRPDLERGPQLVVVGAEAEGRLSEASLAARMADCRVPVLNNRVVVDPDGAFAGVAGADCGRPALHDLKLPATGAWRVIDLSWAPQR